MEKVVSDKWFLDELERESKPSLMWVVRRFDNGSVGVYQVQRCEARALLDSHGAFGPAIIAQGFTLREALFGAFGPGNADH